MPDVPLVCTLRQKRSALGLSQLELAERVGVSRQALSAIEAGRQVPSTTLALLLARELRCALDQLFVLAGGPVIQATLASDPGGNARVVVGQVDGRWVAHPLHDESQAADGVLLSHAGAGDACTVELFCSPADLENKVLVAGCAPLLGVLACRLGRRHRDTRAAWVPAHSARSLDLLAGRLVHIAGVHLADTLDPDAHVRAARRALPGERATLINLARWQQGLVVAGGNPLGIESGSTLLRPGLRYATRERGAGAQRLLARTLREARGDRCAGEPQQAELPAGALLAVDHAETARLVRWGVADLGVAIEAQALAEGLGFVPLAEERFDLILPDSRLDGAAARFLDVLDAPSFRTEAAALRGYDLSLAGQASSVAPLAQ
jgi:molybdate-binding protein/DNA-binding XRE family transcriptional regulator